MASKKKNLRLNSVSRGAEAVIYIVLGLFSLCCIIPFIFVIIISFSAESSIRAIGYSFIPQAWSTDAFSYAFQKLPQIWRSYFNSVFITVVGTALSTLMCALYSYVLYRPDFKFRGFFNFLSFFTMIFGGGLVPTYIVCSQVLGLSENYGALIVPLLVNPFNIIIMRTFFKSSVPLELIEAATIDGSGEYNTLFRVVAPIAKPGVATIALLNALVFWNDWYLSLLYIKRNKILQPLQALLMELQNNVEYLSRMAGQMGAAAINEAAKMPTQSLRMVLVVLIVVPIACAYPFFQRYIVAGLSVGSVKG
ncbi:MAG: carbohydrate ABC transporter permease [Oscillospiraceae bacterium]|jgi:putative aldouronate transport system permease protein|nr:carbohydrate ABC transporter permease [Oscillospiraceae bacterium]MDE7042128.1 carbohydrate ABC transporter permease [Oscillospiraceae bacterium]